MQVTRQRFRCDEPPVFCGGTPYSKMWPHERLYGGVRKLKWPPAEPKFHLPFGLWVSIVIWVLLAVGMAFPRAEDSPQAETCPSVERVVAAARHFDSHVMATTVRKADEVLALAHAYANAVGALPAANLAVILLFSRGGKVLMLGTEKDGLCWIHPEEPPYEAISAFFMPHT